MFTISGASSAELKAAQQNEKNLQKKLKDAEANAKRDVKAIEMRASKAEHALQKIQSTFDSVTSERDTLRADNAKVRLVTVSCWTVLCHIRHTPYIPASISSQGS